MPPALLLAIKGAGCQKHFDVKKQVQVCLCITSDANASRVNVRSLNKLLLWDAARNRRSLSAISR